MSSTIPKKTSKKFKDILKASQQSAGYAKPVRIILVSRENTEKWEESLNRRALKSFEEIALGAKPYLRDPDVSALADDVRRQFYERTGFASASFQGVEAWLTKDEDRLNPKNHRLPLIVMAASIHAVLKPDQAFRLGGADILGELAKLELRRVRSYSRRDFNGEETVLEKLLALSLLTYPGLLDETIFALADTGLSNALNGQAMLEAARKTPFWQKPEKDLPAHLQRLQPDRLAAAFMLLAFDLPVYSPGLPDWLVPAARQAGLGLPVAWPAFAMT